MKKQAVATNSDEVVRAVSQRLVRRKPPTLAQTEDLLEQLAIAEIEIGLLRAALFDASEALESALRALARQQQHASRPDDARAEHRPETLAAMYDFLLMRVWDREHEHQPESELNEHGVGSAVITT